MASLGVNTELSSISSATGVVTNSVAKSATYTLPWEASNISSTFFQSIEIDPTRWDSLWPYRLVVIDSKTNSIVSGPSGSAGNNLSPSEIKLTYGNHTSSVIVDFLGPSPVWICQLPITPQQLSISDFYAIQTSFTLRGTLEEHGGMRFKMINVQGTLGVWPQRSSVSTPPGSPTLLQSVFGGTIEAVGNVVSSFNSVINAATGGNPNSKPPRMGPEDSSFGYTSTGYYQALKLEQFLEQYVEAKKDPANASWRLVLDLPKQNQSLVVTPITYVWNQNANKPLEILYNFQLKAWRRVVLNQTPTPAPDTVTAISPGLLQQIQGTISAARTLMSSAQGVISAVRSDVDNVFNTARQLSLFVKDLGGVLISVADLPGQLISDFKSTISDIVANTKYLLGQKNTDPTVTSQINAISASRAGNEGLSIQAVAAGQLGPSAAYLQATDPTTAILANPNSNFALLDQISVSSLTLTSDQQNAVDQLVESARQTTIDQLKQYRATMLSVALSLSNYYGTGDSYYSNLYNTPQPTPRIQPISLDEYNLLSSIYDMLESIDILTATTQIDDDSIQSSMEYVAGLASASDINFSIPVSKIYAPVPFGLTMEGIAMRYLGDPQRWLEIVTLNSLQEPYIDEAGFSLPLLSNATGRMVVVENATNLYLKQKVTLKATNTTPTTRTILEIEQLSSTSFLLTLDGLANLDNFTTANGSFIQAYLPGTVNSQNKIWVPSNLPVPATPNIIPPSSTTVDPLTALSGVDLLLTDSNDLAINQYGDFRFSSGLTNIIQALRLMFSTQAGTWLTHPTFGLGVKVGTISSELQLQAIYNSINQMVIQDPRFQSVSKLQVTLNGGILGINLAVTLAGVQGIYPISFALTA